MTKLTIIPRSGANLHGLLVKKELQLRRTNRGTFRMVKKTKGVSKWNHMKYDGWVWFQKCVGDVVVATIQTRSEEAHEWNIMSAFIGFMDRHFRDSIASMTIHYESVEE